MAFLVDLTFDDLQQEDANRSQTHRLISLASYSSASSPRYAAIWRAIPEPEPPSGPVLPRARQIWWFSQDEPFVATGPLVSPILFSMTGSVSRVGGPPGMATTVVYEVYKPNETLPKVSFVATESVGALLDDVSATSEPLAVDAVWYRKQEGGKNQFRVAGLFRSKAAKAVWGLHLTPDPAQGAAEEVVDTQLRFAPSILAAGRSFKRVHFAIPSPQTAALKRQVLVLMRGDAYEPWPVADLSAPKTPFGVEEGGTLVDGPLPLSAVPSSESLRGDQGLTPIAVGANGSKSQARLCITWAPAPEPLPRTTVLIDGAVAGPARLDSEDGLPPAHTELSYDAATLETLESMKQWVRGEMADKNISNAQVAIAYRGRLKVLWSFTRGETGWPLTQPTSKFRVASCLKIVTAALALSMGESFLAMKLPEALGVTAADVPASASERWGWFADTSIEDCLHHLSCFDYDNRPAYNETWDKGRRQLPLQPGDFSLALKQGALPKLVVRPPRTFEAYNNWGYIAVGEAISLALRGRSDRFLEALRDWIATPSIGQAFGYIPKSREASLADGEAPVRDRLCTRRDTEVKNSVLSNAGAGLPPFAPGGYDYADFDLWGPTGGLTMSLATYVRLLQILLPSSAPSALTGPRLSFDQVKRMMQRHPGQVATKESDGALVDTTFALGCRIGPGRDTFAFNWGPPDPSTRAEWEFTWGGGLAGQSGFSHMVFPRRGPASFESDPDSLSVAWIANNTAQFGTFENNFWFNDLRFGAIAIQRQGGWDNDIDLFPALGLV